MDVRHRRCFVAGTEAESLTLAAQRRVHASQLSLSRQIRDLKDEVGALLHIAGRPGASCAPPDTLVICRRSD
jgi:LysR family hca operon transcriptional activator